MLTPSRLRPLALLVCLTVVVTGAGPAASPVAHAQIFKRVLQGAACAAGGFAGVKAGEKIAEFEAKRLKLPPEEAKKHEKAFKIGVGLALCGVGVWVAGTTYSNLSKRGVENRKKEMEAALEDAQPRTYVDPERPTLRGSIQVHPSVVDGNKECRTVEDVLVDGAQSDRALVKYCRADGGDWKVDTI